MSALLFIAWLFQVIETPSTQIPSISSAQPQLRQAAKASERCSIEGVVLKAATGEPLKKAVVTLRNAEGSEKANSATTDLNGRFRLRDVEPGRYHLEATRNGYARQEYGQRASHDRGTILTLRPGEEPKDISFRLILAAVIAGRVYDEDGEAVAGAEVQALQFQYENGQRKLMPFGRAETNDLGEYRLYGLRPGHYYVSATYNPGRYGEAAPEGGYSSLYYPGTDDPSRAAAVELHGGEEVLGTDLTLVPVRTFNVKGRVYDAVEARPGVHAAVWLMPRDTKVESWSNASFNSAEDPQGAFELHGVKPGDYYLAASIGDGGKRYTAREPLSVSDSDVEGITIAVGPGTDLKGRVIVEGKAASSLNVLRFWLEPRDQRIYFGANSASPKADGTFVIENVADDSYQFQVWGLPEDCYLKAVRSAGEDVLESGLQVTREEPPGPLEVVISPSGGRIEGLVSKEDKPFTGATVVLVPGADLRKQSRLYKSSTTDQNGQFSIRGIAPGDYKLFAWDNVTEGAYQDPEFLRPYEERGKPVHVDEGSRLNQQLELIPSNEPPQ